MNELQESSIQIQILLNDNKDDEKTDMVSRQLKRELLEFGFENLAFVSDGNLPEYAKGIDHVILGTLLISVSPIMLTKFLDFLHAWALRQENRVIKIKIQTKANQVIEVEVPETMSPDEVKKWIGEIKSTVNQKAN